MVQKEILKMMQKNVLNNFPTVRIPAVQNTHSSYKKDSLLSGGIPAHLLCIENKVLLIYLNTTEP